MAISQTLFPWINTVKGFQNFFQYTRIMYISNFLSQHLNILTFNLHSCRLYESPRRHPTPAQKSVSPYKYLHQNIDISDLNKVRGSLMAKLESIAAQEGEDEGI